MDIKDLITKYDIAVPRYTSYPTADKFYTQWSENDLKKYICSSNCNGESNVSIYIHIPFCPKRCHFCGCNTEIYPKKALIERYINSVLKEMDILLPLIDKVRKVTQISFGGGTPNSIDLKYIGAIVDKISQYLFISNNAEIAIECSPAYLRLKDIDELKSIGFNRISLGIQDFHDNVLKAINRAPSFLSEEDLINRMRTLGFKGINIDLVYGLPLQTHDSFMENIDRVISLLPDRLATFSYAHVPWVNSSQKILEQYSLPNSIDKLDMLTGTIQKLSATGLYTMIGMDHFALKEDMLSKAKREGLLKRNFQGYNTMETMGQVFAFGCSAISQLEDAFSQNEKNTINYILSIEKNIIPAVRGYNLSSNQKIVRHIIDKIMCNGSISLSSVADIFNTTVENIIKVTNFSTDKIISQIEDNLVSFDGNILSVSDQGMMIVRTIASAFDPMYDPHHLVHSRSI